MKLEDLNVEQLFQQLEPFRKDPTGTSTRIAYLRVGRGLAFGKVWADYIDHAGNHWYQKNQFYPTIKEALIRAVKSSVPQK